MGRYFASLMCVLMLARWCAALETDQFTPPPRPLFDMGAAFQNEVTSALREAVGKVNERRADHLARARKTSFQFIRQSEERKAAECLTENAIGRAVFDATVRGGYAQCQMEMWIRYGEFEKQPMKFDPSVGDSIYGMLYRPILMVMLSPTVNFHGVYFGTDKLGHIFEQGYEYYEVFAEEMSKSGDEAAAYRKAVRLGMDQENGFFGMAIDGIYSNGDMAANYAGLKFYLNLTRPMVIGGVKREPILVLENGQWGLNKAAGNDFMRPFITDHLNEALNPNKYAWPLRLGIRDKVEKLTPRWMAFFDSTPEKVASRMAELTKWDGEEYGHSGFKNAVGMVAPAEADRSISPLANDKAKPAGGKSVSPGQSVNLSRSAPGGSDSMPPAPAAAAIH